MDKSEFDKAQKKQIEAMDDIARNSMQCCMPKHSLCDTCLHLPLCPIQYTSVADKCEIYKKLPNSIEELINAYPLCETCKKIWKCPEKSDNYKIEKTSCGSYEPLFKFKEENKMEAWEQVEKARAEAEANAWKDRLKEEYAQLKERYEKITKYKNIQEVELNLADKAQTAIEHYRYRLLDQQMRAMGEYLHILELRAVLESIDLN